MQNETDWITQEDATNQAYRYYMRNDPNTREFMGPIETLHDPVLNREMRQRKARVGTVRGATKENMREVTVYLDPVPHIRVDNPKPLQGWYSNKNDGDNRGQRDRPCETDAILTQPYGGYCFPAGTLVETPSGPKTIEKLSVGDVVWGQDRYGTLVPALVGRTFTRCSLGGLIRLRIGGDSVSLTPDHPVYSLDRGDYIGAGSLSTGEALEARVLSRMRYPANRGQMEQSSTLLSESQVYGRSYGRPGPGYFSTNYMDLLHQRLQQPLRWFWEIVRSLWGGGSSASRKNAQGQTWALAGAPSGQGYSIEAPSSQFGQARLSSKEAPLCRAGAFGGYWSQEVKKEPLCGPAWSCIQSALVLGAGCSRVLGRFQEDLGLRALYNTASEWGLLPSGLCFEPKNNHRGKRLHGQSRSIKNTTHAEVGLQSSSLRPEEASEARFVTGKEVLPKCLTVYDIQTTTHNFYVRGAVGDTSYHVHNCSVGCTSFCYVMSGQYGYRATGLTSVPISYGEYVRKTLATMQIGQAGYFSSFTDPFMKIEEYYHNTQEGATAFVNAGLPIFFLSRLKYPGWAFDLLRKNKYSYMQKSINTPHEKDWRMLSPGAATLAEHFSQIKEARRKGIYVSIQCNPIIPGVVDHSDIEDLIELLAEAGANHVIFKFVESNHAWRNSMVERLTEKFGENRMAFFDRMMTEKQAGNQTTIQEEYRREGHERFKARCRKLGLTSSLCYEYTKRDGRWRSMGPEFLTSDQCHGHRVPWHTKQPSGKFAPLGVCPPAGCLSCADENDGPKCGSELLGSAKALTMADFKKDPGVTNLGKVQRYRPQEG